MFVERNPQNYMDGKIILYHPQIRAGMESSTFSGVTWEMTDYMDQSLLLSFSSQWGKEFTPRYHQLSYGKPYSIAVKQGRSSHDATPWLFWEQPDGSCKAVLVCWSGNWQVDFSTQGKVIFSFPAESFSATLAPKETLPLPTVIVAEHPLGFKALHHVLLEFLTLHWFPQSPLQETWVEWNHWWTYEDVEINETVFCQNVDRAAELGFDLCTLDAGWFGDATNPAHWSQCRGDWHKVNRERFPRGLAWLSEYVHQKGMKFGLWLEPEAMGNASELLQNHPWWEARRDKEKLPDPYLCLGAEGAAEWLYQTLAQIADETKCDWFKLDFNIDPKFGCNRSDHGHQPGLGLYCHYQAYYKVLARFRESHPHVIVENCSSGGLRLDLEMMRWADVSFLSDPDELDHSLQCLWGAALVMPPNRLLHWAGSETRVYPDGSHVFPSYVLGENDDRSTYLAVLRGGMLHHFGISRNLTALPDWAAKLLKEQIHYYKSKVFPLLKEGRLYLLSGQPQRKGARQDETESLPPKGSEFSSQGRATAFQLQGQAGGLIFVFALESEVEEKIKLASLDRSANYRIYSPDSQKTVYLTGEELVTEGIAVAIPKGNSLLFEFELSSDNL